MACKRNVSRHSGSRWLKHEFFRGPSLFCVNIRNNIKSVKKAKEVELLTIVRLLLFLTDAFCQMNLLSVPNKISFSTKYSFITLCSTAFTAFRFSLLWNHPYGVMILHQYGGLYNFWKLRSVSCDKSPVLQVFYVLLVYF